MSDSLKVLSFEGLLGIQHCHELKEKLLTHLNAGFNIIVNISRVDSLDLSCLQTFLAAKKLAAKKQLSFQFSNNFSSEVLESFYACGLIPTKEIQAREINKIIDKLIGVSYE